MAESTQAGTLPQGFLWGAVKAGIKASGNMDLAAAVAPRGANAAVLFTRNQVVAAPVIVGRRHLAATGGRVGAILVNAGNANCATGEPGVRAAVETCRAGAEQFGCIFDEVFPSSTGIIGVPFPTDKVVAALPALKLSLGASSTHAELFATAIMTTDTRRKVARAVIDVDGTPVTLFGVAKGAGMIAPRLSAPKAPPHATMLVYLFTDLLATSAELALLLEPAADRSFNSISIDGDTSTNDTVLLLASGASGVKLDERVGAAFADALGMVTKSLAHQIVDDGEGVTHVVTLEVSGAESDEEAQAGCQGNCGLTLEQMRLVFRRPELGTSVVRGRLLRRGLRPRPRPHLGRRSGCVRRRHARSRLQPGGGASGHVGTRLHHRDRSGRG